MNNVTESNPDRFFENIPETEEATFMFDDASLRAARYTQRKKTQKKNFSINVLISVRKMTVIMDGIDNKHLSFFIIIFFFNICSKIFYIKIVIK